MGKVVGCGLIAHVPTVMLPQDIRHELNNGRDFSVVEGFRRLHRRERALAFAMAIPVKLVFPLIVCFLPGIMTASLGPVVYQIVQVLDQFLKGSLGQ